MSTIKFISPDSQEVLDNEPNLILLDYLASNWITEDPDEDYPNLPLKSKIGFGYHWSDRQRADKSVTLRTIAEPEITSRYLVPRMHDYNQTIWVDFYCRVINTEFDTGVPQNPPKKLVAIKDYVKELVESNHKALASAGIHEMRYDRWAKIDNPDESNVFHGIVYVKILYRLRGVTRS